LADLEGEEAVKGEILVRAGEKTVRQGTLNLERELERAGRWQRRDEEEQEEVNMGWESEFQFQTQISALASSMREI
jgi:hypothetical protein